MKTSNSELQVNNLDSKPSRKAAKGTLQIMVAHAFQLFCGYIVIVILARGLGPEKYGVYGIIMSVLLWVEFSSRLGIPQTMGKLIPENDRDAPMLEKTAIGLTLGISLFAFLLMVLTAPVLARIFNMPEKVNLFRLAALDIPFYAMFCVCIEILGGHRLFRASSLRTIIYAGTKALGILILLLLGLSLVGALIVNAIASIVALLCMVTKISFRNLYPVSVYMRPIMRLAFPMGLYAIGWQVILNLDLWSLKILGKNLEEASVGLYVAATNVAKVPGIAAFVMTAVLIPSISRALVKKDFSLTKHYVQEAIRFLTVTLLPVCTLIAFTADDIMSLLYSETYRTGGVYLGILVFGFGFMLTFLSTFSAILIAKGEPFLPAFISLALIPFGILLNVILVPKYGAIGAAKAELLTVTIGTLFAGFLIYRRFKSLINFNSLIKILLATSFVAFGATIVPSEGLLVIPKCFFLLVIYVIILMALGEIKRKDLQPFALWQK